MLKKIVCPLALAVMCSAVVVAEDQQQSAQQQSQSQSQKDSAAAGAGAEARPAAARDQAEQDPAKMFVKEAYIANLFEIQAGQMAQQKAQDDKAKQFARMMIEDHTKANQKLKQIAQSAQVQLSEQLDPVHQAKLQKMQQIPAMEFTRKYVNSQVAGHWMNVLEFQYQAQNGKNAQVKQYATETLPALQKHLQHAMQMAQAQIGGSAAQPASARQPAESARDAGTSADRATDAAGGTTSGVTGDSDRSSGQSGTGADTAGQSDRAGQSGTSGAEKSE